jgi:hypothetical protein
MNQETEWVQQRIALLRRHLREWKVNTALEVQARKVVIDRYREEKAHVSSKANPLKWAEMVAQHTQELTNLSTTKIQQRGLFKSRQSQESAELETQIKQAQISRV